MLPRETVLVLGAGINGAAIARELLLNGVPVCLVDRWDIASGTTAYSSRLIHGGLRYLEYGEFGLVRESLDERERLLRLAPQFVRPVRLFVPVERRSSGVFPAARKFFDWPAPRQEKVVPRGLWLVRMGLQLYDWFARGSRLPHHRVHRCDDRQVPPVNRERFRWLVSYYDAQIQFPERFVLAMLADARHEAAQRGVPFEVYTYHRARRVDARVTLSPVAEGTVPCRVSVPDLATVTLEPAVIVNATGAWVDQTLSQLQVTSRQLMGGTKGSHLLTRNPALRAALADCGVYAEARDGRPVFVLPFGPFSLVGTTDLPFTGNPESVTADADELEYLLHAVGDVFPHIRLTHTDVVMHYCGVRPLPKVAVSQAAAITRRHQLHVSDDPHVPVISIVGGKLTTCRSLAQETAAWVLARLGLPVQRDSRNRVVPGGEDYPESVPQQAAVQMRLAEELHLTTQQVSAVWQLCGTRTASLLAPTSSGSTIVKDSSNLAGTQLPLRFVHRIVRDEWCCRLADLVERRLMLLYCPELSRATLEQLAAIMVECGVLADDGVPAAVDACVVRLRSHFGREI